jgi:hypothetical protein
MMRGHYAYYGISGNIKRLRWYADQVERTWQKWLSRRDRGSRLHWNQYTALLKRRRLTSSHARAGYRMTGFRLGLPRSRDERGHRPAHNRSRGFPAVALPPAVSACEMTIVGVRRSCWLDRVRFDHPTACGYVKLMTKNQDLSFQRHPRPEQ